MTHRPLARRAPHLRRALPALAAVVLATTGCRGAGAFKISPISDAMTPSTLLGCVAEVAAQEGLPVIEQRADAPEPTLFARSAALDAPQAPEPRRIDMLTVSFKKLGRGLRVIAQTFVVRAPGALQTAAAGSTGPATASLVRQVSRIDGASVGAGDGGATIAAASEGGDGNDGNDGTLWQATAPSLRVAEARDAVLARCGSLGP